MSVPASPARGGVGGGGGTRSALHSSASSNSDASFATLMSSPQQAQARAAAIMLERPPSVSFMRMTSLDHLNHGVPPQMRRLPTPSSQQQHNTLERPVSPQQQQHVGDTPALSVSAEQETFNEMEIAHAARASAQRAAALQDEREKDWSTNRTSELPASMLSEARVLGNNSGSVARGDRYTRAPRWVLSPASQLHHLVPETRRFEVAQLRELSRQRKREYEAAEALRFEERLREKQRRKLAKEEAKRRALAEADEEYRRAERAKRKQRKGARYASNSASNNHQRSTATNASFVADAFAAASAAGAAQQQQQQQQQALLASPSNVPPHGSLSRGPSASALVPPSLNGLQHLSIGSGAGGGGPGPHGGAGGEEAAMTPLLVVDHSALVIRDPPPPLDASPCARCSATNARHGGCGGGSGATCPCNLVSLSSYALEASINSDGLTSVVLGPLQVRHAAVAGMMGSGSISSNILCVHVCPSPTSVAHLFLVQPQPAIFFLYANAPAAVTSGSNVANAISSAVDVTVDYVGDFARDPAFVETMQSLINCSSPSASPSFAGRDVTGAGPGWTASPHALSVSVRALSRAELASGFASLAPSSFWAHAVATATTAAAAAGIAGGRATTPNNSDEQEDSSSAQLAIHRFEVPVRWVLASKAAEGKSSDNNVPGADVTRYEQLRTEALQQRERDEAAAAAKNQQLAEQQQQPVAPVSVAGTFDPNSPDAQVRFLTPSMDPLRTPLLPGSPAPLATPSPSHSSLPPSPTLLTPTMSMTNATADNVHALMVAMQRQMVEHQAQIAALQAAAAGVVASPKSAAPAPTTAAAPAPVPASSSSLLQVPSAVGGEAATAPKRRVRSVKSRTMLSVSTMREHVEAALNPVALSLAPLSAAVAVSSTPSAPVPVPVPIVVATDGITPTAAPAASSREESRERRRTRRRTRGVHPVDALEAAPARDVVAPAVSSGASMPMAAPPVLLSGSDEAIKAERLARRRTLSQVDARRRREDDTEAPAAAGLLESAAADLLQKAEEQIQQGVQTDSLPAGTIVPSTQSTAAAAAHRIAAIPAALQAALLESASAQTSLTWLDEASPMPLVASTGKVFTFVAPTAAAAVPNTTAATPSTTSAALDTPQQVPRTKLVVPVVLKPAPQLNGVSAAASDVATAATAKRVSPKPRTEQPHEHIAHSVPPTSAAGAERSSSAYSSRSLLQRANRRAPSSHTVRPSQSHEGLVQLLVDWEAQLELAENRRAEQLERLATLRSAASALTPERRNNAAAAANGAGRSPSSSALHTLDVQLAYSQRAYVRAELQSLDEERQSLMALELDVNVQAQRERVSLQDGAEDEDDDDYDDGDLERHARSSDVAALQRLYAQLRERMTNLEVLRVQHRVLLLEELQRLRTVERDAAAQQHVHGLNGSIDSSITPSFSPSRGGGVPLRMSPDPPRYFTSPQQAQSFPSANGNVSRRSPSTMHAAAQVSQRGSARHYQSYLSSSGTHTPTSGRPSLELTHIDQLAVVYGVQKPARIQQQQQLASSGVSGTAGQSSRASSAARLRSPPPPPLHSSPSARMLGQVSSQPAGLRANPYQPAAHTKGFVASPVAHRQQQFQQQPHGQFVPTVKSFSNHSAQQAAWEADASADERT